MKSLITQWLEDLSQLPDTDTADWRPMFLESELQNLNEQDLQAALEKIAELSGWHQETGSIKTSRKQSVVLQQKLLAAEWFNETDCIQVSYIGRNTWQWRRIRLQPCAPSEANCLAQKTSHLRANVKGKLQYYRLWQPDEDQAPAVVASVLIDIDEARP